MDGWTGEGVLSGRMGGQGRGGESNRRATLHTAKRDPLPTAAHHHDSGSHTLWMAGRTDGYLCGWNQHSSKDGERERAAAAAAAAISRAKRLTCCCCSRRVSVSVEGEF